MILNSRLLLPVIVAVCVGCSTSERKVSLDILTGPTLSGKPFDGDNAAGMVVVLEFFAEYCLPCERSLPIFEELNHEYDTIWFIGVSVDDLPSDARKMVERTNITFPVIHDDGRLKNRFSVVEIPTTIVIDASGVIRWVNVGGDGTTRAELIDVLDQLR